MALCAIAHSGFWPTLAQKRCDFSGGQFFNFGNTNMKVLICVKPYFPIIILLNGFHKFQRSRGLNSSVRSRQVRLEKKMALYQMNHLNHFNPPRPLGTILIKTLPHLKKHSILISHFSVMDFALGIGILSVDLICGNLKLP